MARGLRIRADTLRRWIRQVEQKGDLAFPGHAWASTGNKQVRLLIQENRRLREERDVLQEGAGDLLGSAVRDRSPVAHSVLVRPSPVLACPEAGYRASYRILNGPVKRSSKSSATVVACPGVDVPEMGRQVVSSPAAAFVCEAWSMLIKSPSPLYKTLPGPTA